MAVTLGTNVSAYNARMKLNSVVDDLNTTMTRLSTGLKINRAGDDAAGLVISQNMDASIRGSNQAMKNIQTANAYLTIAEDGMSSVGEHLQRINDLLTNMANDTNDSDSRTAAVREIIERLDEINRLSETTNFNGRKMIDGTATSIIVQMGPDETVLSTLDISPALTDCHVSSLGVTLPPALDPNGGSFDPSNANCRAYMGIIQGAISTIATARGLLGAYENRLDSSYDSMSIRIESLETAKSHYVDTDIAEETTNLTSRQIMEQVNVAILSSANSLQQMALSLLSQ